MMLSSNATSLITRYKDWCKANEVPDMVVDEIEPTISGRDLKKKYAGVTARKSGVVKYTFHMMELRQHLINVGHMSPD